MFDYIKGKKLLILAGSELHCKVVNAAKEMGIYTIVTDYLTDSPAKLIADEAWLYSVTDVDAIVERCKAEKVDGVLNFCIDPAQKPYQQICEQLGLPCYGTKEQFDILTDKRKFKDYCIAHNVDVIQDYTAEDVLSDNVEYPIFVKPNDSRGSRGQSVCHNKEEALAAFEFAKSESSNATFICEKFLEGKRDIATAFFVVDGEPYLVKFGNRYLGKKEDNLEKQVMCTYLPSDFNPDYLDKLLPRIKSMIKSMGIKFGPVFMQGFADGDTIRFYDPAMRMPGGRYDILLKAATGFDTVKSAIHFALTGDTKTAFGNPENAYKLNGGIAVMMSLSARPGKIAKIEGLDEICKNEAVISTSQFIPAGSVVPASGDIKQRVAAIGAYLKNEQQAEEFIKYVYATYKVLDENGNNLLVADFER